MSKEIRNLNITDSSVRAVGRSRVVEGRAIVFNKESKDLGGFIEVIKPEAVQGVLERSDVLALLNHDENRGVLARATNMEGSLELVVTPEGVDYRFEAPETALGDEVLTGIKRKDIRTSSFAFSIASEGDSWEKRSDGKYLRTITAFEKIYDVSAVYREAYADTSVAVRKLDELTKEEVKNIEEIKEEVKEEVREEKVEEKKEEILEIVGKVEAEKPSYKELKDYYGNLEAKLNNLNNTK